MWDNRCISETPKNLPFSHFSSIFSTLMAAGRGLQKTHTHGRQVTDPTCNSTELEIEQLR